MRNLRKSLLFCLALGAPAVCHSHTGMPSFQAYIDAIKQLSRNCTIDYSTWYSYEGKTSPLVTGRMAISGGQYYDSSNARFVLMNSRWLLMAEHDSKMLSIVYLPDWKKKMGSDYELDISGFLFSNTDLSNYQAITFHPGTADSFSISVRYQLPDGRAMDLLLFYVKGNTLPWRYEGNIRYPVTAGQQSTADAMDVRFVCTNISQQVDKVLFNDERLIQYTGKREAHMLRYTDYKIYKRRKY